MTTPAAPCAHWLATGKGLADGQGASVRNCPSGLAREHILVADAGNNAVRRVTMAGAVSTVAGGGRGGPAGRAAETIIGCGRSWGGR